ncbi:MAG: hypothetical protein VKL60_01180 [Sphaerospermopsis sp.]|nr:MULTISPECIES: hypothetical protein [Sphaerospermopsis]MEB3147619.1 hypothetical protein [Sphaerospermopsis sp.]
MVCGSCETLVLLLVMGINWAIAFSWMIGGRSHTTLFLLLG